MKFLGRVLACPRRPAPPTLFLGVAAGDRTVNEDEHVEATREVARIEGLRIDDLEGKLELLEEPPDPTRWHRSTIPVPQPDPDRP